MDYFDAQFAYDYPYYCRDCGLAHDHIRSECSDPKCGGPLVDGAMMLQKLDDERENEHDDFMQDKNLFSKVRPERKG